MNQKAPHTTTLQNVARGLLGSFMVMAGTGHLTFQRQEFQAQVPDFIPLDKDITVLGSGVMEIGLGLGLLLLKGRNRVRMGLGLGLFYAAVFPGNIHQYTHHLSAFGLDTDAKRLGRLFFQPVLIGVALWSTGALAALLARRQGRHRSLQQQRSAAVLPLGARRVAGQVGVYC